MQLMSFRSLLAIRIKTANVFAVSTALFLSLNTLAQPIVKATSQKPSAEVSKSAKKLDRLEVKAPNALKANFGYRVSTDLQKTGEKRNYVNRFATGLSYSLNDSFSIETGTAINWSADGQNISKEQDNPSWEDLSVGIDYSNDISKFVSYSAGISTDFPTGNESRFEGIKNISTLSGDLGMTFFDKLLSLKNSVSVSKFFHSNEFSVSTLESNIDLLSSYTLQANLAPVKNLSFGLNFMLWNSKLLNGENLVSRNRTLLTVSYKYSSVGASLGYVIGNYEKSDGYKLLYFDDAKRVVRFGVSFEI